MNNLVILGAGTAGTMMANRMVGDLPAKEWKITVIDRDDVHVYQPGLLFLPFHGYREAEIVKPRGSLIDPAVDYVLDDIDRVDPAENVVALKSGRRINYDILVIATGSHIHPEQTEGMTGQFWQKDIFDFYSLDGASKLAKRLNTFEKGRLIIDTAEMPIKCPVAPLEFAFLADAHFRERGIRDQIELVYVTPLDGAFTKPKASAAFGSMLDDKGIKVVTNFAANSVKADEKVLTSYGGQEEPFDLLVSIPLHGGSDAILRSELGDDIGFVPTHKNTLQAKNHDNIFVIGDATDLPTSKAGAVAHFEGDVLAENLIRYIDGRALDHSFDGHANCFVETGNNKAMLIDFNYDTEPLPGRFPIPGIGPFKLLEESEINHWGKLGFKWIYWNILVKGGELPLDHRMLMAGKRS